MDSRDYILNKLYLNPVIEANSNRKNLHPIHIKSHSLNKPRTLAPSRSVPNIMEGLNGTIIMQNWNTKKEVPKDIGQCLNLPVIVDRSKVKRLMDQSRKLPSLTSLGKLKLKSQKQSEMGIVPENTISDSKLNPNEIDKNIIDGANLLASNTSSKFSFSHYSKKSFMDGNTVSHFNKTIRSNITDIVEVHKVDNNKISETIKEEQHPQEEEKQKQNEQQHAIAKSHSMANMSQTQVIFTARGKKRLAINFATFDKHLYLHDNDFLYAKRVGGPVDFALCSYQEINKKSLVNSLTTVNFRKRAQPNSQSSVSKPNVPNKITEYITISKNTVLHYQNGVPQIYSMVEWVDNYVKYKKLMEVPLFKNFKVAKLFELWRRFFKKTKRAYYTEKLKKKFHLIDLSLLKGILEIKKLLRYMNHLNLFKLDMPTPVILEKFNEIYVENLQENNRQVDEFRSRVKRELAIACNSSYKEFKKAKNITLDDNPNDSGGHKHQNDDSSRRKNSVAERNPNQGNSNNSVQAFLKDAIPYAQDATRKTHYKKILRFIRLVDFLFNESKFKLIQNSMDKLNQKYQRLYDVYVNEWADHPILTTMIVIKEKGLSYNPPVESIRTSLFDHFVQENIYAVIYKKNFIDPQEFPTYMTCFEEVFEISVDQNSNLNGRIKENATFLSTFKQIQNNFDKCHKALEQYVKSLVPVLSNFLKYTSIDFKQLEETATPEILRDLMVKFYSEEETVRKLPKKVNIGVFEFQLESLLNKVLHSPRELMEKLFEVIPIILVRKLKSLIADLSTYDKTIEINPNDVDSFIRLKKACEACTVVKPRLEDQNDEIRDLVNIVNTYKEIKMQDYDLKLINDLSGARSSFERRYDSVSYYIDNNIKRFRGILQKTIKDFDNKIITLINEINDQELNTYNDDASNPIMILEDKSRQIQKAVENKKVYQQQEIDIEMDESQLSNFENLDTLTYEYELKMNLWTTVRDFQDKIKVWDQKQVLFLDLKDMNECVTKWVKLCNVAIVDLENTDVPTKLLEYVSQYEKIVPIVTTIQNNNVQEVDYLRDNLKTLLGINFAFDDINFSLEKLMSLKTIETVYDDLTNLNIQANEERRLKDIARSIEDKIKSHKIPLKSKNDADKGSKYIIYTEDLEDEYEFIEEHLMLLNKELLNKYIDVMRDGYLRLINGFSRYMLFLEMFNTYQIFMLKCEGISLATEFSKEMPIEHKKLSSESLNKTLHKNLKDYISSLERYLTQGHDRIISNLTNLITNYETHYHNVNIFLERKRKEYQPLFLLTNDDLMELFIGHETLETRINILLKIYPWMISVNPGNENDEVLKFETFENEKCVLKYSKNTRTLRDAIETIEQGLMKKLKDTFKQFKREYDNSTRPKSMKTPREVVFDFVRNKDKDTKEQINLGQCVFSCVYFYIMDTIEKGLSNEEEAFDKLFDLYNESKNIRRVKFIKMLKNDATTNTVVQSKILLSLIALENHFISIIENLIREDVTSTSDFAFMKVINYKIENENLMLKLYSYNYEYGYEYVGIQNNFYILNQSERMFIQMFNLLSIHKPLVLYSNNTHFQYETLHLISKCFGKYVYTLSPSSTGLTVKNVNYGLFSYMRSGGWLTISNCISLSNEMLTLIGDRICEIYRCIHSADEEGIFVDVNGDQYEISIRGFTTILSFRDVLFEKQKDNYIPKIIKDYYRACGVFGISVEMYLRINLNNFVFCNIEMITKKIMFVLDSLKSKITLYKYDNNNTSTNNDLRNYNHNMHFYFIKLIKQQLRPFIGIIRPETECQYVMKVMQTVLVNFIEDFDYLQRLLINVFDTKRLTEYPTVSPITQSNDIDNEFETALKKELSIFRFENDIYESKIKAIYSCLGKYQHILIVGDCLSGKSNILVTLNEVGRTLNKINSVKYKKVHYVKIFQKAYYNNEVFCDNNIKSAHQNNNVLFNNMIMMFDELNERMLNELEMMYHQMISCPGAPKLDKAKYVLQREHNVNDAERNEDNVNEVNVEEQGKQAEGEQGENAKQNANENEQQQQLQHNINTEQNVIQTNKEHRCICFDGNIDIKWLSHLTFISHPHHLHTFSNGETFNTSPYTFIYETTSLSQLSPDLLTRQMLFTLPPKCVNWDNLVYAFVETNAKLNANADLKNYIRGLFENYIPPILDFIHVNKIKCISTYPTITNNYIILNFMRFFDAMLPEFDFNDNKIGRRNKDATPKIEKIKTQALSFFIFSCAWVINFTTNFLIKTKIEKLINDVFKTDDLKGPIFDYYITTDDPEKYEFDLWANKFALYQLPTFKKNEIFYYDKIFITTQENLPYQTIITQLLKSRVPFLLIGRDSCGKSFLMKHILSQLPSLHSIKTNLTYNTQSTSFESYIISHMDQIKKNILGDKFDRSVLLYIDDIHIAKKDEDNNVQIYELLRQMLSTNATYNNKDNYFCYFDKFNIVNVGNYVSHLPPNEQFSRFLDKMNIVTINIQDDTYSAIYKPSLEFCFRNYIPNTSGITANQYIGALFKLKELLGQCIQNSFDNLHYCFSMRDITKIVQSFHLFIFNGTTEYPEYLKKIFFYESYMLYKSKINNETDLEIFKDKICEAYSSFFKQDKLKKDDIFNINKFDNPNTYIFAKNYLTQDKTQLHSHIFYNKKQPIIDFVIEQINSYYKSTSTTPSHGDHIYIINQFQDDYIVDTLIRMLRLLEHKNKNMLLLGDDYSGKDTLLKIALFINKYDLYEIDMQTFTKKTHNEFEIECIHSLLKTAVYSNRKVFFLITYQITSNANVSQQDYCLEIISSLMQAEYAVERFKEFIDEKNNAKLPIKDIISRIEKNINIVLSLKPSSKFYEKVFLYYPHIVNNSNIIFVESLNKKGFINYAKQTLQLTTLQSKTIEEAVTGHNEELLTLIHSFAGKLYEMFSTKINMNIPITQNHFMKFCNFIINNYTPFKNTITNKKNNLNYVQRTLHASSEVTKSMQAEIDKLTPQKESLENQIEQCKQRIAECTQEKNMIKVKRMDEERPMNYLINECNNKENTLTEMLDPYIEGVRKYALQLQKLTEKDIVEIKNTYDGSAPGKYMLSKVYESLNESNTDWDYIKKTLEVKTFKHFVAINISKAPEFMVKLTQEIISNPEYGNGGDKYQKPYRIIGILCDYFVSCWSYFGEHAKQKEVLAQIKEMKEKIAEHKRVISLLMEDFKKVEARSNEYEKNMAALEISRGNYINQIQKHKSLLQEIIDFADNTKEKKAKWDEKETLLSNILINFDLYIIYISAYAIYAPVLNWSYRKKFSSFLYEQLRQCKNASKDFKAFTFSELMFQILDSSDLKDRDLLMAIESLDEYVKENFILMKKLFPTKIPYIIDYNQIAQRTIEKFVEFKEMKIINSINENTSTKGELRDKIEKSLKIGSVLFINDVSVNIYNYLNNFFTNKHTIEHYKKYIRIEKDKFEVHENFQLYLLKTNQSSTIDIDAFNYALVINFNSHCNELKGKLFHIIAETNHKSEYVSYRKSRNEFIKERFKLVDLENKMNKSIMSFDMSGNVEKLTNMQVLNEKYKQEVQLYTSTTLNIDSIKERVNSLRESLYNAYGAISEHAIKLYKWINRYFMFDMSYVMTLEYFGEVVNEFIKKKTNELNGGNDNKANAIHNTDEDVESQQDGEDVIGNDENELSVKYDGEKYVYNAEKDLKELIIFVYNAISHVYVTTHRREILLMFLFVYLHIQNKIESAYTQWLCFAYKLQSEPYPKDKKGIAAIQKSPVKNISDFEWTKLQKMNTRASRLFDDILQDMNNSSTKWSEYLSEDTTAISNASIHYLKNNLKLPGEDIESKVNEFSRFILFYILKPFKSEMIIDTIINNIISSGNNNSLTPQSIQKDEKVLVQAFRNLPLEKFMLLIVPKVDGKVHLNYYDKELRDYCMKELLSNNPDVKYKEIVAKGELNLNEIESIQFFIKTGGVIIIKNIHLIKESFTTLIQQFKEAVVNANILAQQQLQLQQTQQQYENISNENDEDKSNTNAPKSLTPQVAKFVLVTHEDSLLPNYVFSTSTFINRISKPNKFIRDSILELIRSIPTKVYNNLLNIQNTTRKILRKFIISYIILYGIISGYEQFHLLIPFTLKDFYNITSYLDDFFTNLSEDKISSFLNPENIIGFNYNTLLNLLNEQYIYIRFIYKNDMSILRRILNMIFNTNSISNDNVYISCEPITISIDELPLDRDITFDTLYSMFIKYSYEEYDMLIINALKKDSIKEKHKLQIDFFSHFMCGITKAIQGINAVNSNNNNTKHQTQGINMVKVNKILNDIKNDLPKILQYDIEEAESLPDENIEINQFLFKINKVNDYTNPLDECLLNEILYYNSYLTKTTTIIDNLIQMTQGLRCFYYDECELNNIYFEALTALNKNQTPFAFIDNKIFKHINKHKYTIDIWKKILTSRFDNLRLWIKEGYLEIYHLPLFTNINLFFSRIKVHFIRKVLNDIANNNNVPHDTFISPDMVKLSLHFTRFTKYEDIETKHKDGLKLQYGYDNGEGDVVFVSGLNLLKAKFEKDNTSIVCDDNNDNGSEMICTKCNIAVISCSIRKYVQDEENKIDLECDVEKNEFDSDYDEYDDEYENSDEEDDDDNMKHPKGKSNMKERENGEDKESDTLHIKVVDASMKNDNNINCYDECLCSFDVQFDNKEEVVSLIEKGVKIYIDDIEDYIQIQQQSTKNK